MSEPEERALPPIPVKEANRVRTTRLSVMERALKEPFAISRGVKTHAVCILAEIADAASGRGLATPYPHFGETARSALDAARALEALVEAGAGRDAIQAAGAPGAARNAVDLALWDLEAKQTGRPVHEAAGLPAPRRLDTFHTLIVADPDDVERRAARMAGRPIKLKLAGDGLDAERIARARAGAPTARLVLDANEGLDLAGLEALLPAAVAARAELIEQPTPPALDDALAAYDGPVPLCADESVRGLEDLEGLSKGYRAVNVKLDKAGGLTGALAMVEAARAKGLMIMVGCMAAPSLAIAPAAILAAGADFVDLDGPFLVAEDDEPSLAGADGRLDAVRRELWG